jgi:hypothetical protein
MQYSHLGKTGMKISRRCLGTMNFGDCNTEQEAFRMMDEAFEMGINFFDTADAYGTECGQTEQIIGRWFAQGGGRRGSESNFQYECGLEVAGTLNIWKDRDTGWAAEMAMPVKDLRSHGDDFHPESKWLIFFNRIISHAIHPEMNRACTPAQESG